MRLVRAITRWRLRLVVAGVLTWAGAPVSPARAEEIELKNGGRLSGKVTDRNDERITVEIDTGGAEKSTVVLRTADVAAVRPAPPTARDYLAEGDAQLAAGDAAAANVSYERALAAAPREPRAWVGIAKALAAQNRKPAAVDRLRAALLLAPANPDVRLLLGDLALDLGNPREARRQAEHVRDHHHADKALRARAESLIERAAALEAAAAKPPDRAAANRQPPAAAAAPGPAGGGGAGALPAPIPALAPRPETEAVGNNDEARAAARGLMKAAGSLLESERGGLVRGARVALDPAALSAAEQAPEGRAAYRRRVKSAVGRVEVSPALWSLTETDEKLLLVTLWWEHLRRLYPGAEVRVDVVRSREVVVTAYWSNARRRMVAESAEEIPVPR
ncbi:MAG: hypothetical protein HY719_04570 [Planctomycetes bacterium]|nr:hypothetical protein [Planctomycetota bacterium]